MTAWIYSLQISLRTIFKSDRYWVSIENILLTLTKNEYSWLEQCDCDTPPGPTNEDLFLQNACYANCGQECVLLEDYEERRDCMSTCPCKCNKYCISHCESIGLTSVCETSWGCIREKEKVEEETEKHSESHHSGKDSEKDDHEESEDDKEEDEDDHHHKHKEKHHDKEDDREDKEDEKEDDKEDKEDDKEEEKHDDKEAEKHEESEDKEKEDAASEALAVTAAVATQKTTESSEFKKIISKVMDESEYCDPTCWRQCLQKRATKDEIFNCVNNCGCGYESPNLLVIKSDTTQLADGSSSTGALIFLFLAVLVGAFSVGYYVYRREFDHKLHQDLINEDDAEGYERLD